MAVELKSVNIMIHSSAGLGFFGYAIMSMMELCLVWALPKWADSTCMIKSEGLWLLYPPLKDGNIKKFN